MYDLWTKVKHVYEGHDTTIHLLLPFAKHLISVDEDSQLKVWDINSEGTFRQIPGPGSQAKSS